MAASAIRFNIGVRNSSTLKKNAEAIRQFNLAKRTSGLEDVNRQYLPTLVFLSSTQRLPHARGPLSKACLSLSHRLMSATPVTAGTFRSDIEVA